MTCNSPALFDKKNITKNDNNSTKQQLLSQCKQLHSSKYLMIAKPYLKKSMIATTTERQVKALVVILTEIN